jgi:hypothetical protein
MHRRGGRGIPIGEEIVRALGAEPLIDVFPPFAGAGGGSRREVEPRDRRAQVEARPADDDRCSAPGKDCIDRRVRELLVLAHGCHAGKRPDPDEVGREIRLVRQDREAAIDLHRVRGNELGGDPRRNGFGDGRLSARRRPEDRDHVRRE